QQAKARSVDELGPAAQGTLTGSGRVAYHDERLVIEDARADAMNVRYEHKVELAKLSATAPKLVFPSRDPFPIQANASARHGGTLSARGDVALQPFSADLHIEAQYVAL